MSFCETAPNSFFCAHACVPRCEYALWLACQGAIVDLPIRLKGNSKHTSGNSLVNLGLRHRLENSSNTGYIAEEEINVIAKKSTLVPTCSTFLLFTSGYQYKWSSCLPITPETDALLPKCWMLCSLTNLGIAFPSNFGSSYKCLILWRNYNVFSYKLTEMIYGCLWLWII